MSDSFPDGDFEDPETEEDWVLSMRRKVEEYLREQTLSYTNVGEWPAWHVAPATSIWAVESKEKPGWVGWWVVCGDHPTDYVSLKNIKHPRAALREVCARWREIIKDPDRDVARSSTTLGRNGESGSLAIQLKSRIRLLEDWAANDEIWDYDEAEFENP